MTRLKQVNPPHPGTDEATSRRLASVKRAGSSAEMIVRPILREAGFRMRYNVGDLPGRPDMVSKSLRLAIFVHGCFWHGHAGCLAARLPQSNRWWWKQKQQANRDRDRRKKEELLALKFRVVELWTCELSDIPRVRRRVAALATAFLDR
ncbi:MAG: very short patch repair endonuclease [Pseudomonadota bacterium]